ncbi:hypothetical protein GA0115239_112513 [Streptomyces sp. BpilaLS-43]|uniref:hypothetical protein n=1 Tax=Streptomyces sp. BpilaLS-43 TaxID=1839778 RepID=UPI00081B2D2C|nr:hypothetical protein [Streptomyces sp. BpilaLS-43]SCD93537.1 hypothetical protein GA0115239_112513 [Streptomyces sp. BpilaLS-43]
MGATAGRSSTTPPGGGKGASPLSEDVLTVFAAHGIALDPIARMHVSRAVLEAQMSVYGYGICADIKASIEDMNKQRKGRAR